VIPDEAALDVGVAEKGKAVLSCRLSCSGSGLGSARTGGQASTACPTCGLTTN